MEIDTKGGGDLNLERRVVEERREKNFREAGVHGHPQDGTRGRSDARDQETHSDSRHGPGEGDGPQFVDRHVEEAETRGRERVLCRRDEKPTWSGQEDCGK